MKDAYDRGELNSWVEDIDVDNIPEVPSKNRDNYANGFGDDFTSDFMEAMRELRYSLKLNENDDTNVSLAKIKVALDRGELRKLHGIKKTR